MSYTHLQAPLRKLQATAFDGSVGYPRFREDHLAKLYNGLSAARTQLMQALQQDLRRSEAEAQYEVALALACAKEGCLETGYARVTAGEAAELLAGRVLSGVGVVVVVADEALPLLSIVKPFAAALTGGNAVAAVLSTLSANVNAILKTVLGALEPSSVLAINSAGSTTACLDFLLGFSLQLLVAPSLTPNQLNLTQRKGIKTLLTLGISPSPTLIVSRDRPAPLRDVARLAVRGQFLALGRLPGSVARVLVHDEVAAEFVELLLEETKAAFGINPALSADYGRFVDAKEVGRLGEVARGSIGSKGKLLVGGDSTEAGYFPPTILEGVPRGALNQFPRGPILACATFTSLEGMLAMLDTISTDVLYLFAEPDQVKYVADATHKTVVYANDVPLSALFSPDPSLASATHFTRTTHIVTASATAPDAKLFAPFTSAKLALLARLLPREARFTVTRVPFNNTIRRVFFLQGVFITLGTVLAVVGAVVGYSGWMGVRWFRGV